MNNYLSSSKTWLTTIYCMCFKGGIYNPDNNFKYVEDSKVRYSIDLIHNWLLMERPRLARGTNKD